jgi:hypothetical protein
MNDMNVFPRWLCKLLSYISTFTLGMYVYASTHGVVIEGYRWIATILFGTIFYICSLPKKQKKFI